MPVADVRSGRIPLSPINNQALSSGCFKVKRLDTKFEVVPHPRRKKLSQVV